MTDIVERLGDGANTHGWVHPGVAREAAAEIERLRARNTEHEERYSALEAMDEYRRLENERLRAALKPFAEAAKDAEGYHNDCAVGCDPAMELSVEIDEGAFGPLKVIHLRRAAALSPTGSGIRQPS